MKVEDWTAALILASGVALCAAMTLIHPRRWIMRKEEIGGTIKQVTEREYSFIYLPPFWVIRGTAIDYLIDLEDGRLISRSELPPARFTVGDQVIVTYSIYGYEGEESIYIRSVRLA